MEDLDNTPPIDTRANRIVALIIAFACAAPLLVASQLTPSGSGTGTHMQMGLPDCGFKTLTGYPCATCGCTTAFSHAAHGSLLQSFLTQPFGAVLAMTLAIFTLVAIWSLFTGMPLSGLGAVISTKRAVLIWSILLVGAWAYKALTIYLAK